MTLTIARGKLVRVDQPEMTVEVAWDKHDGYLCRVCTLPNAEGQVNDVETFPASDLRGALRKFSRLLVEASDEYAVAMREKFK